MQSQNVYFYTQSIVLFPILKTAAFFIITVFHVA